MKLRVSWIQISQELLPHSDMDSETDLKTVTDAILDTFEIGGYSEEYELDEKIIQITTAFFSKTVSDIPKLIRAYELNKWGKTLSGDISTVIGESITYSLLIQLFNINIKDLLPFRNVKYLATISDLAINIEKYEKLKKFLNAKNGILFVNARATMSYRRYYIAKKLSESLISLETIRYPDNYGLISYIIKYDNQLYDLGIIIRP
ncbi:MAG: hypothetical protein QXD91_00565 [Saccharolobus sp.]